MEDEGGKAAAGEDEDGAEQDMEGDGEPRQDRAGGGDGGTAGQDQQRCRRCDQLETRLQDATLKHAEGSL